MMWLAGLALAQDMPPVEAHRTHALSTGGMILTGASMPLLGLGAAAAARGESDAAVPLLLSGALSLGTGYALANYGVWATTRRLDSAGFRTPPEPAIVAATANSLAVCLLAETDYLGDVGTIIVTTLAVASLSVALTATTVQYLRNGRVLRGEPAVLTVSMAW